MIPVKEPVAANAHISSLHEYRRLYEESIADPDAFWRKQAERIDWFHPFHEVSDIDLEEIDFAVTVRVTQPRRSSLFWLRFGLEHV